jgi:hypothetical protein
MSDPDSQALAKSITWLCAVIAGVEGFLLSVVVALAEDGILIQTETASLLQIFKGDVPSEIQRATALPGSVAGWDTCSTPEQPLLNYRGDSNNAASAVDVRSYLETAPVDIYVPARLVVFEGRRLLPPCSVTIHAREPEAIWSDASAIAFRVDGVFSKRGDYLWTTPSSPIEWERDAPAYLETSPFSAWLVYELHASAPRVLLPNKFELLFPTLNRYWPQLEHLRLPSILEGTGVVIASVSSATFQAQLSEIPVIYWRQLMLLCCAIQTSFTAALHSCLVRVDWSKASIANGPEWILLSLPRWGFVLFHAISVSTALIATFFCIDAPVTKSLCTVLVVIHAFLELADAEPIPSSGAETHRPSRRTAGS